MTEFIRVLGANQNNLKNLNVDIPIGKLVCVTGLSGSGKSSLAFDTLYAEGQRRYVETFSPYARQFLDRMDKPDVKQIEGIPPAIAIDQTNPVRTSRSTVGTMTELNDHLKVLFSRASKLYCHSCEEPVQRDNNDTVLSAIKTWEKKNKKVEDARFLIVFPVQIPDSFSVDEIKQLLEKQGYTRFYKEKKKELLVIQDRLKVASFTVSRLGESLDAAFKHGRGFAQIVLQDASSKELDKLFFSNDLHCAPCDIHYKEAGPGTFSFNSPIGACEKCRGFGRIIGVDYNLVIPDENKTLMEGAVKPWQSPSYAECQRDMERSARKHKIPLDIPWKDLDEDTREWVLQGEPGKKRGRWYGVKGFFDWLETKAYKMHIRVLLSRYRNYQLCGDCNGARLKPEALWWKIGEEVLLDIPSMKKPLNIHEVMIQPIAANHELFQKLYKKMKHHEAFEQILQEIVNRLGYLVEVGLGYLTLDRQSRTLSGGEVQRINLTTALGTSLVNTLFVLDEPSIGLHSRDVQRLIKILYKLRDTGNTLVIVEHDPELIRAADVLIDMGPGPGKMGGEIIFQGEPERIHKVPKSITGKYLLGHQAVIEDKIPPYYKPDTQTHWLEVKKASENNLKDVSIKIPLNRLCCLTGVSGSGKSTFMNDILYNALRKLMGKPVEQAGAHASVLGWKKISSVELVDQSPIGKTTRSTPVSYVGAFDPIRKLLAKEREAVERKYTAGTFSFNGKNGRCAHCSGNGFIHYEMQFLSDVYIKCPECKGKRFRSDVLEIKYQGKSVADILALTVAEAVQFFEDQPSVIKGLQPLMDVGLTYVQLGQPVPTLSGGESQRLKLAGHLAIASNQEKSLFLFDEPTTGLHFADISILMKALRSLITKGHSVCVIEHNLDVIRGSDYLIELGPEGGELGGHLIFEGTPYQMLQLKKADNTPTSQSLQVYQEILDEQKANPGKFIIGKGGLESASTRKALGANQEGGMQAISSEQGIPGTGLIEKNSITIRNAKEHNLKSVDISFPRNQLTVISGLSGSGKSTLAFDILYSEGQRRYLESLNAYARQFVQPAAKPDIEGVYGIPPTVAIEQRISRGGHKSTVATVTEIYHFIRLLYSKLGVQHCPDCQIPIEAQTEEGILDQALKHFKGKEISIWAPLVKSRKGIYNEIAQWAVKKDFDTLRVDGDWVAPNQWPKLSRYKEHDIELHIGTISCKAKNQEKILSMIHQALEHGKRNVLLSLDVGERDFDTDTKTATQIKTAKAALRASYAETEKSFSIDRACLSCGRSFEEMDPRLFSFNTRHGWCKTCTGTGLVNPDMEEEELEDDIQEDLIDSENAETCHQCHGQRLRPEALSVYFKEDGIDVFRDKTVLESLAWFKKLKLNKDEKQIADNVIREIISRLEFLGDVGLGYLTLGRSAPTLSGGEAQRIRLAAQLGSNLKGVAYVLDEPSIGLHHRDNWKLINTLKSLRDKGNTVLVVEHDTDTLLEADHLIDMGPGAGVKGGEVVAHGSVPQVKKNKQSVTGKYLREPLPHPLVPKRPTLKSHPLLKIKKAHLNNLQNVDVELPLGRLICVTGVSGSGKSTLIRKTVYKNLETLLSRSTKKSNTKLKSSSSFRGCKGMDGIEHIKRILEVDQTPIGRTPRSCPATYIGFWDEIRKIFANLPESKIRGYKAGRFSFNVSGGRCPQCEGQGSVKIEMNFLPDVSIPCDLCNGKRFNPETMEVLYKEKSVADVLAMSVEDAVDFFEHLPKIHRQLKLMNDVGLGYLQLGQASPTLSGGEAQRIKLISELVRSSSVAEAAIGGGLIKDLEIMDPKSRTSKSKKAAKLPKELQLASNHTLYLLDEPSIGLHTADVEKLINVLHRIVDAGHTVVLIEHNLDLIAEADWILDMGPEGGDAGGKVLYQGKYDGFLKMRKKSETQKALKSLNV